MNIMAIGAYLRVLREEKPMTQAAVARAASRYLGRDMDVSTVHRLERGKTQTDGDVLLAVLAVLNARLVDVAELMGDGATIEHAQSKAYAWLDEQSGALTQEELALLRAVDPTQRQAFLAFLAEAAQQDQQRAIGSIIKAFLSRLVKH